MLIGRRQLLRGALALAIAPVAVPVVTSCDSSEPPCADPELMSAGERQMRETLAYSERSSAPARRCAGCRFFTPVGDGACGRCEILDGLVHRGGQCSSWSARA